MLLTRLNHYTGGTVMVRVSGPITEKFINLCVARGIGLWNINKYGSDIYASMALADYWRIRPVVRTARVRLRVVAYSGLPFQLRRLKRRKMLVAGAILFIILLQWVSSYVWFVDVTGTKGLPVASIKELAADSGLKPGTRISDVNPRAVENAILLAKPEIAWVGVGFSGTRAVVEIVEKTLPRPEDKKPAHVFAAKSGIITEVITIAGQPSVKAGDAVKVGDLLIKGFPPQPAPSADQPSNLIVVPAQLIRASGIVKAQIRYEAYGEGYMEETLYERSGARVSEVSIAINGRKFNIRSLSDIPYAHHEVEVVRKTLPVWRNCPITVESTINIYHELNPRSVHHTAEEAREAAKLAVLATLTDQVPETAQLVTRNIELVPADDPNTVRVKATVETIEEIGETIPIGQ